jgi:dihydroceramide fatty acyl 2-hydroxylase
MSEQPGSPERRVRRAEVLRASPPMFDSPALDRLTRVHPAVPALIYGPAIVLLTVGAYRELGLLDTCLALAGGYAFWTLCEYWAHRVVFHYEPDHPLGARLHWMLHGVHHDHPSDPRRLVLPPALSLPLAVLFLGLFLAVLGEPLGLGVCAGFYAGYLLYDMVHFALHHRRPRSRLGRRLYELHMRHHFEDEERGFGVSAPWWDMVFGTYGRRRSARRSGDGSANPPPPR